MIVEQLIFVVIAFAIFVYMFLKMIKTGESSYVIILVIEAIGIAINFLEVLFSVATNPFFIIIKYIFAVLIPLIIIYLEKNGKSFAEESKIIYAKILLKLKNNRKAKTILLELASKYPDNYEAHRLLALLYEDEGGMRKAIDEYVQALDINKRDYDSYYRVANLLNTLEKKDEASQMLFSLLEKKPEYQEASILLGDILIEKGEYKEAERVYQNALRYNPTSYEINYSLGIVYTMLNDFQNAKMCYEKAATINSLSYNSKYALAEIALLYKNVEEAEQKFLEVVEDELLAPEAYYQLAKISMIKGEEDTAVKYANIAIELDAKKISQKIKNDPIFIPVISKIAIPFNIIEHMQEEEKSKLAEKDIKMIEHLEEMFEVTRNLSYDEEVKMYRRFKGTKKLKKEKEIEDRESEQQ